MSVQELESSLAQISLDIERQKEVLRDLERSKSLIQRQLNSLRDPVARLPLELSSKIFLQCLPSYPGPQDGVSEAPLLLLHICTAWTSIALATPALWATIYVSFPPSRMQGLDLEAIMDQWLQRARGHLLDISFDGEMDRNLGACILRYSGQLKRLDIYMSQAGGTFELLGGAEPLHPLPSLEELTINGFTTEVCSWRPILKLLSLSTNLVKLDFENMSFVDAAETMSIEKVMLPNLSELISLGIPASRGNTLEYITAPSLETFILSPARFPNGDLVSFLKYGGPEHRALKRDDNP
ncbi:hypothetical protein FB45DRAFT_4390 [Roridomyces roridus]|uniref:F-box domain-containing protein n=1 Tax=Roridomyces roridus TaxID=1738132 RepID=A0AAD7FYC0_9AGAR|nr:hypothetical protein FB45DRAFT_4390 [Roridomyces roridus]